MLLEEGACEEMTEHFILMRRIEQNRIAHMSKNMNEENEWDKTEHADTVEGPIERVMREEIVETFTHLMIGKAPGPSYVYANLILASGDVGIGELAELSK